MFPSKVNVGRNDPCRAARARSTSAAAARRRVGGTLHAGAVPTTGGAGSTDWLVTGAGTGGTPGGSAQVISSRVSGPGTSENALPSEALVRSSVPLWVKVRIAVGVADSSGCRGGGAAGRTARHGVTLRPLSGVASVHARRPSRDAGRLQLVQPGRLTLDVRGARNHAKAAARRAVRRTAAAVSSSLELKTVRAAVARLLPLGQDQLEKRLATYSTTLVRCSSVRLSCRRWILR